jgi:hypothetical protein
VQDLHWPALSADLDANGWAILKSLLSADECALISDLYKDERRFRSHIIMARHAEYKYFSYPLPDLIAGLCTAMYPHLAPIANRWNESMGIHVRYPDSHALFIERCHQAGQTRPTPLLLQYASGDYNALHQDLYGEHAFPLQLAIHAPQPVPALCPGTEPQATEGRTIYPERDPLQRH